MLMEAFRYVLMLVFMLKCVRMRFKGEELGIFDT